MNICRLGFSYLLSVSTGRFVHLGYPAIIAVEPTNTCNLRCPECSGGYDPTSKSAGFISQELYHKIIGQTASFLSSLILYFRGEPFMHSGIINMIRIARQNRIYTLLSTNGHHISTDRAREIVLSGLDKIIISVDGMDQGTYSSYRIGGDLEKVLKGLKNLATWRAKLKSATPAIIIQFLILHHNQHQAKEIIRWGREKGADKVVIKTAQLLDFEYGNPSMPEDRYSRYKITTNGTYVIKNKLRNRCWRNWSSTVFTWDGTMVPCCFDKSTDHPMGNIWDSSFHQIWKNEEYSGFRRKILKYRKEIPICRNCTEGLSI